MLRSFNLLRLMEQVIYVQDVRYATGAGMRRSGSYRLVHLVGINSAGNALSVMPANAGIHLCTSFNPTGHIETMKKLILIAALLITNISLAAEDKLLEMSEAPPGGDFMLHSIRGLVATEDLRGKVLLLTFGYAGCPDICPMTLAHTSQAINQLEQSQIDQLIPLFITLDPERDNIVELNEFARYFDENIVALTGTVTEINGVAKQYGVKHYQVEMKGSKTGYSINHSASTYLVAPDGELRFIFPYAADPKLVADAVKYLVQERDQ